MPFSFRRYFIGVNGEGPREIGGKRMTVWCVYVEKPGAFEEKYIKKVISDTEKTKQFMKILIRKVVQGEAKTSDILYDESGLTTENSGVMYIAAGDRKDPIATVWAEQFNIE